MVINSMRVQSHDICVVDKNQLGGFRQETKLFVHDGVEINWAEVCDFFLYTVFFYMYVSICVK